MTEQRAAAIELLRRRARTSLLPFIYWCWDDPDPLKIGRHTIAFCEWFDKAVERLWQRQSSYCLFNCPPRHGKSYLCSFAYAFFLGVTYKRQTRGIYTGYSKDLVLGFSKHIKNIIESEPYRQLFPEVKLGQGSNSAEHWNLEGSIGEQVFAGLGGGITGKGANIAIIDDYCKNFEEAQSDVVREKIWNEYQATFSTREQPSGCINIITATPWHMDDLTMRIRKRKREDPNFPQWDELCFPAMSDEYGGDGILFPELYTQQWYKTRRSTIGNVKWSAMYMCNPVGEGQRLFRDEWLNFYSIAPTNTENYIFVDTAGSKKRKNNDYLVMWVIGIGRNGNYYVLDGVRDKLNLTERTEIFMQLVEKYRPRRTWWEQIGAQTDLEHVQLELERHCKHTPITPLGQTVPKEGRILWLEPLFQEGRIWFPDTLKRFLTDGTRVDLISVFKEDEYGVYPSVVHDDMLDCLANIRHPDVLSITAKFDHLFRGNGRNDTVAPTSYKREPWKR